MNKTTPKDRGQLGEQAALAFLQSQGLLLVKNNFRCRFGEIDLILQQATTPNTVVFVEVKLRKHNDFGYPIEMITPAKCLKIRRSASYFLSISPNFSRFPCRFDAIGIQSNPCSDPKQLGNPQQPPNAIHFEFLEKYYWVDWRPNLLFE